MLFSIQPLFFQRIELRIRSDLQRFAALGFPQGADGGVVFGLGDQSGCAGGHYDLVLGGDRKLLRGWDSFVRGFVNRKGLIGKGTCISCSWMAKTFTIYSSIGFCRLAVAWAFILPEFNQSAFYTLMVANPRTLTSSSYPTSRVRASRFQADDELILRDLFHYSWMMEICTARYSDYKFVNLDLFTHRIEHGGRQLSSGFPFLSFFHMMHLTQKTNILPDKVRVSEQIRCCSPSFGSVTRRISTRHL